MKKLLLITEAESEEFTDRGYTLLETLICIFMLAVLGGTFYSINIALTEHEAKLSRSKSFYSQSARLGQEILTYLYTVEDQDIRAAMISDLKSGVFLDEFTSSNDFFSKINIPEESSVWKAEARKINMAFFKFYPIKISNGEKEDIKFYFVSKEY